MTENPFAGSWTYRSVINEPNLGTAFEQLAFGRGTLVIDDSPTTC